MPPLLMASAYALAASTLTFALFAWDKRCAVRGRWRVRESTLLTLAAFGGMPGAIAAARVLRHKTRKEPFRSRLRLIAAVQAAALAAVLAWWLAG